MPVVPVALPHHRYEVIVEPGVLDRLGAIAGELAPHNRCAVLADEHVFEIHGGRAVAALEAAGYAVTLGTMPPGEANKTLETVRKMYDVLLDDRLERRSPVIALGGGNGVVRPINVAAAAVRHQSDKCRLAGRRLRRDPGMPCTTSSLMLISTVRGKP